MIVVAVVALAATSCQDHSFHIAAGLEAAEADEVSNVLGYRSTNIAPEMERVVVDRCTDTRARTTLQKFVQP